MKKVLIFLVVVSLSLVSCSQKSSENIEWIPFSWTSFTLSGKNIEKASMNIPVTIDELPYKFTVQFDLGAYSCFYGNSLKPFLEEYPLLKNKLDTTKQVWINGVSGNLVLKNINLRLGDVIFEENDVGLFINFGTEHSLDTINYETEVHIGTIGADFVQNKVLIIDYKSNRLALTDTVPSEYQNISFEPFKIDRGRIKIPFRINGNIEHLMFDTGSSIFSLVTTKQNALAIGGTEIVDSLNVPSWGELIPFYGLKTVVPIMFGNKTMESSIVYYNEDPSWDNFYKSEKMWGLTGNAYFFNNLIIIDYKNNRIGVK